MLNQATGPAAALGVSLLVHAALLWMGDHGRSHAIAFAPPPGKAGAVVAVRVVQQKRSTKVEDAPAPPTPAPPEMEFEKPSPKVVRRPETVVPPEDTLQPAAVAARRNAQAAWAAEVDDVRREPPPSAPPPRPKVETPPEEVLAPPKTVRPLQEAVLAEVEVVAQLDEVAAQQSVAATGAVTTHPPQATYSPRPLYPPQAMAEGREGEVKVRFTLDAGGIVRDVRVERSSGRQDFDAEAVRAMSLWRFTPSRRGDTPVPGDHTFTFTFRIPRT